MFNSYTVIHITCVRFYQEGIVFTCFHTTKNATRNILRPPVAKRRPPMALCSSGRASLVANACGQVARLEGFSNKQAFF